MSIYYRSAHKPLSFKSVLAALPTLGIQEYPACGTDQNRRCLTDGKDYLWIGTGDGSDTGFDQFNINCVRSMLAAFAAHFQTRFVNDRELGPNFADEQASRQLGYLRLPREIVPTFSTPPNLMPGLGAQRDPIPAARRTDLIDTSPTGIPMAELWDRCKQLFQSRDEKRLFAKKAFQAYRCLVETHWNRFSNAIVVDDLAIGKFFTPDEKSFVQIDDNDNKVIVTAAAKNVFGSLIFLEQSVIHFLGKHSRPKIVTTYQNRRYKSCIQKVFAGNGWPIKL